MLGPESRRHGQSFQASPVKCIALVLLRPFEASSKGWATSCKGCARSMPTPEGHLCTEGSPDLTSVELGGSARCALDFMHVDCKGDRTVSFIFLSSESAQEIVTCRMLLLLRSCILPKGR